jgi:hypothetical protein
MTELAPDLDTVDEEAAEALLRAQRARTALRMAPDLAAHLRTMLTPSDGRTEPGELPELRTPLLTDVADAADELFAVLLEWATAWAITFDETEPVAAAYAHRNYQDSHPGEGHRDARLEGFRAGTTPKQAAALTRAITAYLLPRHDAIAEQPAAPVYFDEVTALVWRLRSASGLTKPHPTREPSPRPCPLCGEYAVRAEYFGGTFLAAEKRGERLSAYARRGETPEDASSAFMKAVDGVEVRCSFCGWEADARPSKIAKWLA